MSNKKLLSIWPKGSKKSIIRALRLKPPLPSGVRFAPCFAPLRALQAANAAPRK